MSNSLLCVQRRMVRKWWQMQAAEQVPFWEQGMWAVRGVGGAVVACSNKQQHAATWDKGGAGATCGPRLRCTKKWARLMGAEGTERAHCTPRWLSSPHSQTQMRMGV
eukprot:scaffold149768_cov18-Tisochrysis_lutea.AAC.1